LGYPSQLALTDRDLIYVMDALRTSPDQRAAVGRALRQDAEIREAMLSDPRVHDAIVLDPAVLMGISAQLLFAVLLFRVRNELAETSYTIEAAGAGQTAVFDSSRVSEFMHQGGVTRYLLGVLTSFVRIEHTPYRHANADGTFALRRVSSFDLEGLIAYCAELVEQERFATYRQIVDLCLFMAGGTLGDEAHGFPLQVWEDRGVEFYALAARHRQAQRAAMASTLQALSDDFSLALEPLRLLFSGYLGSLRNHLFQT